MHAIFRRILSLKRELVTAGLVIIISSLSFALGYISNRDTRRAPIIIEKCDKIRL